MTRALLLALLSASIAVAGCATPGTGDVLDTPPPEMTTGEAQALLAQMARDMPDAFGMIVSVEKGGEQAMRMEGSMDNATGEAFFEVTMDPSVFEDPEEGEGGEDMYEALADGFSFYMTPAGMVYMLNDTAFTFPSTQGEGSFIPSPEETPFGQFLQPTRSFGGFENVTVHSVRPVVHRGQAAYEINATVQTGEETTQSLVTVYQSPARLARMETSLPAEADDGDPLSGGVAIVEMLYDDEAMVRVTEAAKRAAGLRYDGGGFSFTGGDGPKTWTFQGDAGIPLAEVEARVKDPAAGQDPEAGPDALSKAQTLWAMKLSEGTKTTDGLTLTFTDADGDGMVSPGDTLVIDSDGADDGESDYEMPPQVVLYDTVTGTHVIPGAGWLFGALALAGAAALVGRRRRA